MPAKYGNTEACHPAAAPAPCNTFKLCSWHLCVELNVPRVTCQPRCMLFSAQATQANGYAFHSGCKEKISVDLLVIKYASGT
eukprot:1160989-Pelagomonas_calceolata.AAC.4